MNYSDVFVDVTKHARKIPTSEYNTVGKHPIIDQGQKQIAGYTDLEQGLFTDVPAIIFGDHTRIIKYIDTPFFIGADGVKVIKSLDKGADYKYCYYLLKSARIPDTGYNRHYKWLKESVFPEHNKQQQKQIVDTLTAIDKLMCKYIAEINKLDELIKSRFVEMFGDPKLNNYHHKIIPFGLVVEYMGDIGSNGANKVVVEHLDMKDEEDYALMVRFLNFTNNDFTNNVKYISKESYDFFKKSKLFGGELIICKIGSAGLNYVMPNLNRPVSLGLNQIMVRLKKEILMPYLYQYLHTEYGEFLISECVNGAVTKSITKTKLKELPLMLPPIHLQSKYADFVTKVEQQKATVQKSIDKLETLKKSLMQEYFG